MSQKLLQEGFLRMYSNHTPFLTVWVKDSNITYQLLNSDGSEPAIKQENASTNKDLALIDNYSLESYVYRVSIAVNTTNYPSPNYSYYVSRDGGDTLEQVQYISCQERALGAYVQLRLMQS